MKKTIKLAVVAALALGTTSAFATNGDHLIGLGAKARGMGGVGIGLSHGAESALVNPALISSVKNSEISFGGTIFMPDVSTDMGTGGDSLDSDATLSVIPEVSVASRINENFTYGIGMFGVAGMGTDYRDGLNDFDSTTVTAQANGAMGMAPAGYEMAYAQGAIFSALGAGNFAMVTNLQLMQFAIPLAYNNSGFSIGFAPVLQYGSLDINYNLAEVHMNDAMDTITSVTLKSGSTQGVAQDFGMGFNFGLAYETNGLTVGASYKSAINMTYKGQISQAMADFTQTAASNFSDDLEQPAEMGVGVSYSISGNTIALDVKQINWSDAKGYKDFGWKDQTVYALGYEYAQDTWAVRLGYNYAKSAIEENTDTLLNTLNLLGFPATVESHMTIGGTYAFNNTTSVDLAYTLSPEATDKYDNMLMAETETKHSQSSVSFQLNYAF